MSVYLYLYIYIIWREICITHIISYQYYISGIIYHTSAYIHNICLYIYIYIHTFKNKNKRGYTSYTYYSLYIYIYACFCLHTYLTPLQLNHIYLSQSEAGHKILQCLPIRSTELVPSSLDSEHMVNMVTSEYNVRLPTGIGLTRLTGFPLHRVN